MSKVGETIRDLARKVRDIAVSDEMQARRDLWRKHNSLIKVRPPVMCRPCGAWDDLLPEEHLASVDPLERTVEMSLRMKLLKREIGDDEVIEPWVDVDAIFSGSEHLWGVPATPMSSPVKGGAWKFNPPIKEESDLEKLRVPEHHIDEQATLEREMRARDLLDGILDVHVTQTRIMGAGLGYYACYLRGMDQLMVDMLDRPEWTHRLMAFLRDAHLECQRGAEKENQLALNNNASQINCVAFYCDDLPQPDYDGEHIRLIDLWEGGDSQEFGLVSPDMMDEFLLQYQLPILEQYGLVGYGCCESFHKKWHLLRKIPRLRRFSVSPWTRLEEAVEEMGTGYVLNWRVNPARVLFEFTEEEMRIDVEEGLRIAGRSPIEVVLQDIEIIPGGLPQLQMWVRVAREVAEKYA